MSISAQVVWTSGSGAIGWRRITTWPTTRTRIRRKYWRRSTSDKWRESTWSQAVNSKLVRALLFKPFFSSYTLFSYLITSFLLLISASLIINSRRYNLFSSITFSLLLYPLITSSLLLFSYNPFSPPYTPPHGFDAMLWSYRTAKLIEWSVMFLSRAVLFKTWNYVIIEKYSVFVLRDVCFLVL